MEVEIVEGEGAVLVVNVGHPIVTNEILCVRGSDTSLPKLLWDSLLLMWSTFQSLTTVYGWVFYGSFCKALGLMEIGPP